MVDLTNNIPKPVSRLIFSSCLGFLDTMWINLHLFIIILIIHSTPLMFNITQYKNFLTNQPVALFVINWNLKLRLYWKLYHVMDLNTHWLQDSSSISSMSLLNLTNDSLFALLSVILGVLIVNIVMLLGFWLFADVVFPILRKNSISEFDPKVLQWYCQYFFFVYSNASWLVTRYVRRKMLETILMRLSTIKMYVLLLSETLSVSWDSRNSVERMPSRNISYVSVLKVTVFFTWGLGMWLRNDRCLLMYVLSSNLDIDMKNVTPAKEYLINGVSSI